MKGSLAAESVLALLDEDVEKEAAHKTMIKALRTIANYSEADSWSRGIAKSALRRARIRIRE